MKARPQRWRHEAMLCCEGAGAMNSWNYQCSMNIPIDEWPLNNNPPVIGRTEVTD